MTLIVWDGKTLATDTALFCDDMIVDLAYPKIIKLEDFVISGCGDESNDLFIKEQLDDGAEVCDLIVRGDSKENELIVFERSLKTHYWYYDEFWSKRKIKQKIAIGAGKPYAIPLLNLNETASFVVKEAIKYHCEVAGKVDSIDVGEYFKW